MHIHKRHLWRILLFIRGQGENAGAAGKTQKLQKVCKKNQVGPQMSIFQGQPNKKIDIVGKKAVMADNSEQI